MKSYKIEGVILRTTDFGDANRVVTIFTRDFGKIEVNAYGCRRAKNSLSGALQMFNLISAEVNHGAKLDTIKEADIIKFYPNLTADLEKMSYAALFFEIVNRMTLPKFPEVGVYDLILKTLPTLDERNAKIAALIGIFQFMEFSGEQLNFFHCVHCGAEIETDAALSLTDGGAICPNCIDAAGDILSYPNNLRETVFKILNFDWQQHLNFNLKEIDAAEKIILRYVQSIIGKELNAVKFIRQLENLQKN
ncbi:MAG: DNA repair protein RecO [Selenomonadaceae bacterium]|nr:DNA repair protein RecO [Selenomonadaceae bacterium]